MPENAPLVPMPLLSCDLCRCSYPALQMAPRGKPNFCPGCMSERPRDCLVRIDRGDGFGTAFRWLKAVVVVICLCLIAVTLAWCLPKVAQFQQITGGIVASDVQPQIGTPLDSTVRKPGSAEIANTDKELPWFQTLLPFHSGRSVEDAGKIHLLFVTRPGTDACRGLTSYLFVTREAASSTSAKLETDVGADMATSFQEGLRYVRKQPRDWEHEFSIRLSFEDKFSSKDGGSAGTGFTLAMLAATRKVALDPDVAVTGDLTVDGTVQPVGAVVEKMRGALEGKCKIALVPERNARDITDMALLDGTSPLWEMQIFSIGTIEQAFSLARQDRTGDVQKAIARFDALRARLPATVTPNYLQSPEVQTELKEIVRLAPNHLSAGLLLRAAQYQLPQALSLNRSVDEILSTGYLFVGDVFKGEDKTSSSGNGGIPIFPEREFNEWIKTLHRLTPILDTRSWDLKNACMSYVGCLRAAANYQPMTLSGPTTRRQFSQIVAQEGNFRQQTLNDLSEARARMLLAMRKLDTDGSLASELRKK